MFRAAIRVARLELGANSVGTRAAASCHPCRTYLQDDDWRPSWYTAAMPQKPMVRKKKKARRSKKLAAWRANQEAQQTPSEPPKK